MGTVFGISMPLKGFKGFYWDIVARCFQVSRPFSTNDDFPLRSTRNPPPTRPASLHHVPAKYRRNRSGCCTGGMDWEAFAIDNSLGGTGGKSNTSTHWPPLIREVNGHPEALGMTDELTHRSSNSEPSNSCCRANTFGTIYLHGTHDQIKDL